jgi:hypothetical protein
MGALFCEHLRRMSGINFSVFIIMPAARAGW